jgi:hypothetical protein
MHIHRYDEDDAATKASEARWLDWVATAKKIVGHDLDGDGDEDGYSLDEAYEAYERGDSASDYAAHVAAHLS